MLRFLATFRYTPEELVKQITTGTVKELGAIFDARVFVIPDITEVYNYFVFRQQDCTRNSVSMAASANFSHFQLHGLSGNEKQEMLFSEKAINWNDYKPKYKRGVVVKRQGIWVEGENGELVQRNKWIPDYDTPEFSKDREYLQNLIPVSK
jgi:tRNA(His) 5'-end guanylyltransferase